MVAYSFKAQFEDAIVSGAKTQTVRGNRKRHALPGEALQLYTAMRTKHCRKLLTPDPICLDVRHIGIGFDLGAHACSKRRLSSVEIDGIPLNADEIEAFAIADGFFANPVLSARQRMAAFWQVNHGGAFFDGVVIRWERQR